MFGVNNGIGLPTIIAIDDDGTAAYKFATTSSTLDDSDNVRVVASLRLRSSHSFRICVSMRDSPSCFRQLGHINGSNKDSFFKIKTNHHFVSSGVVVAKCDANALSLHLAGTRLRPLMMSIHTLLATATTNDNITASTATFDRVEFSGTVQDLIAALRVELIDGVTRIAPNATTVFARLINVDGDEISRCSLFPVF